MTRFMSPDEQAEMYRRATVDGGDGDWDGADEHETTKLQCANQFERNSMLETAAELRAEAEAEDEAIEAEQAAARHEQRSAAARKAAQTRKERQAERATALAAAIVADARQSGPK